MDGIQAAGFQCRARWLECLPPVKSPERREQGEGPVSSRAVRIDRRKDRDRQVRWQSKVVETYVVELIDSLHPDQATGKDWSVWGDCVVVVVGCREARLTKHLLKLHPRSD